MLRDLLERAALAIAIYDTQGQLLWCNLMATRILGVPDVADPVSELIVTGAVPDDEPLMLERPFVLPDGTRRWGVVALNWVTDQDGGERRAIATVANLNAQKRAELMQQALVANMRSSADAIIGVQDGGTITAWNAVAEQLFGFSTRQVMGKSVDGLAAPGGAAALRLGLSKVALGETVQLKTRAVRADKRQIDVLIDISPVRDGMDRNVGALLVVRDISAERVLSEQLASSMRRYQALLEAVPDQIFRFRADGTLLDYVPAAGTEPEANDSDPRIGENLRELLPTELANKIIRISASALRSGETRSFEYSHGSATRFALRYFEGRAVRSGDDEVVWIARDITARKQGERLRARFVEQVTAAEDAERRRIARELHDHTGQVLTSVVLRLQALQNEVESETLHDRIDQTRQHTESAIVDIRRLAHGLHPRVLDDLGLAAALQLLAAETSETVGFVVDLHLRGPTVHERMPLNVETALYRVAQEALTNVTKHAEASYASLLLERTSEQIALTIEDDGHGVSPLVINGQQTGGLGLVGIRERLWQLEGALSIQSPPEGGTVICAIIPLGERSVAKGLGLGNSHGEQNQNTPR